MVGATSSQLYLSACSINSFEKLSPLPPMPCSATSTCSLAAVSGARGGRTYIARIGVPAIPLVRPVVPGLAAMADATGHNAMATIRANEIRPSVRGIEPRKYTCEPRPPKEAVSGSERLAVEAQIIGHVVDPVDRLMRTREHVPSHVDAFADKSRMNGFDVRQPDVFGTRVHPHLQRIDAGTVLHQPYGVVLPEVLTRQEPQRGVRVEAHRRAMRAGQKKTSACCRARL